MQNELKIRQPDDWHLHLRDGEILMAVIEDTASHFGRAMIMPNLVPPVVTTSDVLAYKKRIKSVLSLSQGRTFEPMMAAYLTETTDADDLEVGFKSGVIQAVKLYPAGATTNSASGVRDIKAVSSVLERMEKLGIPLLVHGEVVDSDIDIFDREAVFIDRILDPLRRELRGLRVVMEHITTKNAVEYVKAGDENLAATITTHHLMINRNHILAGGIRPHYYCLPVAKREEHRLALRDLATSGFDRVFLGTDSAPHLDGAKLQACGCAGIYTAPNTMSCLAQVFDDENALPHLEAFCSLNGANFYGLEASEKYLYMSRASSPVSYPEHVQVGDGKITVFNPGIDLYWRVDKVV